MNNEQNNMGTTVNPSDTLVPNVDPNGVGSPVTPLEAPVMPDVMGMPSEFTPAPADTTAPGVVTAGATAPEAAPVADGAVPMPDASIAPGVTMPAPEGLPDSGLTLDPSIAGPQAIQPYTEPEPEPKKKKVKPAVLALIILLIIALGVGGFALYIFVFIKPAKIHSEVITEFFNNANNYITASMEDDNNYKTLKQVAHMSFDTNFELLEMINDYSVDYTIGINPSKNVLSLDLALLEKSSNILGGAIYWQDDGIYFQGEKIYDGVIRIGEATFNLADLYDAENSLTKEEVTYLIAAYRNYLINSFDESKYERKLTTEKINGKSQKVFNNYYVINEAVAYQMSKSILESFRADSKALEIIAKSTGLEVSDITPELDEAIKGLTDPQLTGSTTTFSFNVYTSIVTNKVLAVKFYEGTSAIFEYYDDNGTGNYTISYEGMNIVATSKEGTTTIKVVYDHDPITDITIKRPNENSFTMTINITLADLFAESGLGVDSLVFTISNEKKDAVTTAKFTAALGSGDDSIYITVTNEVEEIRDKDVSGINASNAIDYYEIDSEEISENIRNALKETNLYSLIAIDGDDTDIDDEVTDIPNDLYDGNDNYDSHCPTAYNCRDCTGTECTCTYSEGSFSTYKEYDITCPKK